MMRFLKWGLWWFVQFVMATNADFAGLLDSCIENGQCESNLCTGRPGKSKKCRFCARKQEICTSDEDCCQTRQFPITSRYCEHGQCKKRNSPVILAYSYSYSDENNRYSLFDTKTLKETIITPNIPRYDVYSPLNPGRMALDSKTGTIWTSSNDQTALIKRNAADWTVEEEFTFESAKLFCMQVVDGKLYAIMYPPSPIYQEQALVTINAADGVPTTIGKVPKLDGGSVINDLAYDGTNMYAVDESFKLFTVDIETGNITSPGVLLRTGIHEISDIDFAADGVLYGKAGNYPGSIVYKLDKITGEGNEIGVIPDSVRAFSVAS